MGSGSLKSTTYTFDDTYRYSDGIAERPEIRKILVENIPGATCAYQSTEKNDRRGIDWHVDHASGRTLGIDLKARRIDPMEFHIPKDDLALEIWSVEEKGKVGWTRDKKKATDYVLWMWEASGRWCLVPFPMLCAVFIENWEHWAAEYGIHRQFTPEFGGYHSVCIFVPRRLVWGEMYRKFSGVPMTG